MKIFSIVFFLVFLLHGCASKPCPEPPVVTLYKEKVVYKETPCKVPDFTCDFSGEGYDPTVKLLECISLQKRIIETCQGK